MDDGIIAVREYEVMLPDGTIASISFTLGDLQQDSIPAEFARSNGALAYGLVSVEGVEGAPDFPMLWTRAENGLNITASDDDGELSDELRKIIARAIAVFFRDLGQIAPELARIKIKPPKNALH
jgi:hypothetical protein